MDKVLKATAVSTPASVEHEMKHSLEGLFGSAAPLIIEELGPIFLSNAQACMREIELGLAQQNATAVAANAHTLKGSSANLGLGSVSRSCLRLQEAANANDINQAQLAWRQLQAEFTVAQIVLKQYG